MAEGIVPVVLAASGSGLLDALDRGADTADNLAHRCGLDLRATRLVLDALAGLGVCDVDAEGRYARPGGLERTMPWASLPAFLASGEVHPAIDGEARGPAYAAVVPMLGERFARWAARLAEALPVAERILDVGAGSGVWSLAMAARSATAHVTALDLPEVLPAFERRARAVGLGARTATLAGSYFERALGGPFDRVVLANVLHLETPDDAARLIARVAPALAPGGEMVIVDCVGEGEAHEPSRSLYALHLGLRTARGAVHRCDDLAAWCAGAGLARARVLTLEPTVPAVGAVVATRPS